jgi:hypothetical protein
MPPLNQVTIHCCIWQHYNYYITITLPPNQIKSMNQIFKFEKESAILSYKVFMFHVYGHNAPSMAQISRIDNITVDPIMTRLRMERPGFDIRQGQKCFSPSRTARRWVSPSLLHNGYRWGSIG